MLSMSLTRCHNIVRAEAWTLLSLPRTVDHPFHETKGKARIPATAPRIRLYRHQGADFDDRVVISQDQSRNWYEQSRISAITHRAKHEYARVMVELMPDDQKMDVLVLGCGGASIPHEVAYYKPMIRTTVVDNSLAMLELAKYLVVDKNQTITWQHADAYEYLKTTKYRFDLIICDIFDIMSGAVPDFTSSHCFLSAVSRSLKNQGNYVQNILARPGSQYVVDCIDCIDEVFRDVQTHVCSSKSDRGVHNIILTMQKRDQAETV